MKSSLSFKEFSRNTAIVSMTNQNKKTPEILIVDDSYTTITLEKNILKSAGYNVLVATNGSEALKQLSSENVDLIITDLEMPVMSGIELIEKIRTRHFKVPIIVLTAKTENEIADECYKMGANDYILKRDFSEKLFLEKIRLQLQI